MTLSVDSIATDADLANELGGVARLNSAQADIAVRNAYRASALVDVLGALSTRTPAILDTNLTTPAQLKMAVVYRTLSKICFGAATGADNDRNLLLAKKYQDDYLGAVRARFDVSAGPVSGPSGYSISFERR